MITNQTVVRLTEKKYFRSPCLYVKTYDSKNFLAVLKILMYSTLRENFSNQYCVWNKNMWNNNSFGCPCSVILKVHLQYNVTYPLACCETTSIKWSLRYLRAMAKISSADVILPSMEGIELYLVIFLGKNKHFITGYCFKYL